MKRKEVSLVTTTRGRSWNLSPEGSCLVNTPQHWESHTQQRTVLSQMPTVFLLKNKFLVSYK